MGDIRTVRGFGEAVYTDRKSVFTARAWPVDSEEEALSRVKEIKKQYPDARHNCYAFILRGGIAKRYSDDGEPQGTAGKPILDVLEKNGLEGVLVVVTRYFGGILLGTGGLVHAYSESAASAVKNAGTGILRECDVLSVSVDYSDYSRLSAYAGNAGLFTSSADFGSRVTVCFNVPADLTEKTLSDITELTGGRALTEKKGKIYSF